jgi:23S rRNA pseudouridine1911/1915/1917 synthase
MPHYSQPAVPPPERVDPGESLHSRVPVEAEVPDAQDAAGERMEPSESSAPALRLIARGAGGQRLDQFIAARLDGISRTRVQRWIDLGAVRVDQVLRLPSYRLNGHEEIEVEPQPLESEQSFRPDPVPLDVLYRDDDLLVLNKPAGLVTHPAPGHWRNTLMNGLLFADPRSARLPRAGIVHRLDRDTSGVLVCARSERAFVSLTAQLAERSMRRQYLAIVGGAIGERGRVESPIGRDPRNRLRMAVVQPPQGRPARTDYEVLASGNAPGGRPCAALVCRLHTGRTHQIRVHLASIGHPLVGDATYGGEPIGGFHRQALHAWRLSLQHPTTARQLTTDCPVPEDLLRLIEQLGMRLDLSAPPLSANAA